MEFNIEPGLRTWGRICFVASVLFWGSLLIGRLTGLIEPAPEVRQVTEVVPPCSEAREAGVLWADQHHVVTVADCAAEAARRASSDFGDGCERHVRTMAALYVN